MIKCVVCSTSLSSEMSALSSFRSWWNKKDNCRICGGDVCSECTSKIRISHDEFLKRAHKGKSDKPLSILACKPCEYIKYFYDNIYHDNDFFVLGHIHDKENSQALIFITAFLRFIDRYHEDDLKNIAVCFEAIWWGVKYGCHDSLLLERKEYDPIFENLKKAYFGEQQSKTINNQLNPLQLERYFSKYIYNRTILSKREQTAFLSAYDNEPPTQILFNAVNKYSVAILKYDSEKSALCFLEKTGKDSQQYKYHSVNWNDEKKRLYKIDKLPEENFILKKNKNSKQFETSGSLYKLNMFITRLRDGNKVLAKNLHNLLNHYDNRNKCKYIVPIGMSHIANQVSHLDVTPLQSYLLEYKYNVFTALMSAEKKFSDINALCDISKLWMDIRKCKLMGNCKFFSISIPSDNAQEEKLQHLNISFKTKNVRHILDWNINLEHLGDLGTVSA